MSVRAALAAAVAVCLTSACMPVRSSSQPVGWQVRGAALVGDVDGDGRAEELAIEETGPSSCRLRLRARSARGTFSTPVHLYSCAEKPPQNHPSVVALAAIDRRPGLEIVVELGCGAHTCMGTIFGVESRRLREWRIPPNVIRYGGSVGTGSHAVDCVNQRGIVVATSFDHRRSLLFRTWHRARGGRLERTSSTKSESTREGLAGTDRPFARCTVVRARLIRPA